MTIRPRPIGVTILAALYVIAGGLWMFWLVTLGGGFGLVSLGVGAILLAIGYGTWTLKPWARTAGMAVSILSLFVDISSLIRDSTQIVTAIPSIAIAGLIIWYLNTAPVKAAFARN